MRTMLLEHVRRRPGDAIVLGFTLAYLLVASWVALERGNREFVLYVGLLVVALAAVSVLHLRVGLSSGALWCLSLWGVAHMAGGLMRVPGSWPIEGDHRVLYSWWLIPDLLKYDQLVHAFGFGVTTWVCWQSLRAVIASRAECATSAVRPTFGMLILCWSAGLGFGALNEVLEFIVTLLVPETNVGGYINTGWDLVSNLVGATIACTFIRVGNAEVRMQKAE